MKLRFYLRGLGIGMAVTAVILHFAVAVNSHAMSDDEIRARARQLGMTEEGVMLSENTEAASGNQTTQEVVVGNTPEETAELGTEETVPESGAVTQTADTDPETQADPQSADTARESDDPETGAADTQTAETEPATQIEEPAQPEPVAQQPAAQQPEEQPQPAAGEGVQHGLNPDSITVTVVRGDTSYSVAKRMAEAGIVPSAAEFDEFLCKNGYDRTLCVGVHAIPSGASYDEMGRILTGK